MLSNIFNIFNRVSHSNLNQPHNAEGSPPPVQPSSSQLEENSDQKPARFNAPKSPAASSFVQSSPPASTASKLFARINSRNDISLTEKLELFVRNCARNDLETFLKSNSDKDWTYELNRAVNDKKLDIVQALISSTSTKFDAAYTLARAIITNDIQLVNILLSNPEKFPFLKLEGAVQVARREKRSIEKLHEAHATEQLRHHEAKRQRQEANDIERKRRNDIERKRKEEASARARADFKQRCATLKIDPPSLPELRSRSEWHGMFSQTLDVYRLRTDPPVAVFLWTKGPSAGQIFDIFDIPENINAPNADQLLNKIDRDLDELNELVPGSRENEAKEAALIVGLMKAYFVGVDGQTALQYARLNDKPLNCLLNEIHQTGIKEWLKERATSRGLKSSITPSGRGPEENFARSRLFGKTMGRVSDFANVELCHGSESSIIDSVINAKALLCNDHRKEAKLIKLAGESEGGSSYTSHALSFWGPGNVVAGYGWTRGFNYPIAFTVSKEDASQLSLREGTMDGEMVIDGSLPLSFVNKMLVPTWAVKDVQRHFDQHGHNHIVVTSLNALSIDSQEKEEEKTPAKNILAKQITGKQGTNPGGFYEGSDVSGASVIRYIKKYRDPLQADCEELASKIYRRLNIGASLCRTFEYEGNRYFSSRQIENAKTWREFDLQESDRDKKKAAATEFLQGFLADVLMKNWDAVGAGYENPMANVLVGESGEIYRIDHGGSLLMRGLTGRKPEHQLHEIDELEKFFDPSINPSYLTIASLAGVHSAGDVPNLRQQMDAIVSLHNAYGGWDAFIQKVCPNSFANEEDRKKIATMLETRTDKLQKWVNNTLLR